MKLLGRAHDAEFWQSVKENDVYARYRNELHEYWEKYAADFEAKALSYSKWKLFWDTGDRSEYERDYFYKRTVLEHVSILSFIYPDEKKYMDKLMDLIFAICDEYTWCLPAHQGQNQKNDNSRIDLFAAETAFNLAIIYTLHCDRLDPVIKDRIAVEIDRRIVNTYIGCENYGWWECGHTNWTGVCVGAVGCTLMLMRPELLTDAMLNRLTVAMQGFLDGFADDGVCTEGCGYWAYGVSFFVQFADMLKTFTDGKIDYFKNPKVRSIATFPQKMFLSGKAAVSFADGNRTLEYTYGVMHRLKQEYPDDVLIYSPDFGTFDMGCGRMCIRFYGAVWMNEDYYNNPADNSTEFEAYAPDAQWLTKRTAAYGFAAKAGHNAEMHNHNDVGSFIFAKNGKQILADLGAGKYTRQYFSDIRYDIMEPSSRSHSVPVINGGYQQVGREYSSSDVSYSKGVFSMDIAGAYKCDGLDKLVRTFAMSDSSVTLTDEYSCSAEMELLERIVSYIKPEVISNHEVKIGDCIISFNPDECNLVIGGEADTTSERFCYYMDFKLLPGVKKFTVNMR